METQWVEPWYILVYPGVLRSSSPHLNSSACSLILIPLRHPRYMQFNTHTFKTHQVYAFQCLYLQDTQGICSLILIPSRHPRYSQFNTHTFKTPQVYAVQCLYIQDTPGICSLTLIPLRHPRFMQFNTHTFKTP